MITHERHRGRRQTALLAGTIAIFDHSGWQCSEQQVEQIIAVATHQRTGEQQGFAHLGCQNTHGLPLGRSRVLVLVRLVGDEQVERALRQVALDELGWLIATLAKTKLHRGHGALHALGLAVREHQLAVIVHQVDEFIQVVAQHGGQERLAEFLHQLLGGDFTDGGNTFKGPEYGLGLIVG